MSNKTPEELSKSWVSQIATLYARQDMAMSAKNAKILESVIAQVIKETHTSTKTQCVNMVHAATADITDGPDRMRVGMLAIAVEGME